MEDIMKVFLQEVQDIENSTMFMNDDENEPTTDWIEEIDSRTNFPFYWNSITNESVWDKPESYDGYLLEYEKYLKNIMEKEFIEKAREKQEIDIKKRSEMQGLLGYSDSEDESNPDNVILSDCDKTSDNCHDEEIKSEEVIEEESITLKRERWMNDQIILATQYLQSIVKSKSEIAISKVQSLIKDVPNGESLMPVSVRIQTRLEDWEGGYLTIERTVEKLADALINISQFEGDLEPIDWNLQWENDKKRYFFMNKKTGVKKWNFGNGKYSYEDGEILDDEDDLHEYVTSTLHRSLLEDQGELVNEEILCDGGKEGQEILHTDEKMNVIEEIPLVETIEGYENQSFESMKECPLQVIPSDIEKEIITKSEESTLQDDSNEEPLTKRMKKEDFNEVTEGGKENKLEIGKTTLSQENYITDMTEYDEKEVIQKEDNLEKNNILEHDTLNQQCNALIMKSTKERMIEEIENMIVEYMEEDVIQDVNGNLEGSIEGSSINNVTKLEDQRFDEIIENAPENMRKETPQKIIENEEDLLESYAKEYLMESQKAIKEFDKKIIKYSNEDVIEKIENKCTEQTVVETIMEEFEEDIDKLKECIGEANVDNNVKSENVIECVEIENVHECGEDAQDDKIQLTNVPLKNSDKCEKFGSLVDYYDEDMSDEEPDL